MKALVIEVAKYYFICQAESGHQFYLDRNALPFELKNIIQVGDTLTIDKKVEKAS